jgi:hypothetical protein
MVFARQKPRVLCYWKILSGTLANHIAIEPCRSLSPEIMLPFSALCLLVSLFWLSEPINAGPVPSISLRGSEPSSLKIPFAKRLSKKIKMKRDGSVVVSLLNEVVSYDITVEVGTPA